MTGNPSCTFEKRKCVRRVGLKSLNVATQHLHVRKVGLRSVVELELLFVRSLEREVTLRD